MGSGHATRGVLTAALGLVSLAAAACGSSGGGLPLARQAGLPQSPASTVAAPPATAPAPPRPISTTTVPAPPSTRPRPPAPARAAPAPPPPAPLRAAALPAPEGGLDLRPYVGLATWIDVYDWSATYCRGGRCPAIGRGDVDRMARLGAQTLFVQASRWDAPSDVLEPSRLQLLIDRAHERGMRVVAWYLPTLEDPGRDLRRLRALAGLDVDGLAVDIESTRVPDPAERSRRLVALSRALRQSLPGRAIGAIPLDPVHLEVINPRYWPGFPWRELASLYDVWLPMSYWTNRTYGSGYHDGYRYTAEGIDRLRANLGQPVAPVHALGGIADRASAAEVDGMLRAARERGAVGGSLYDYRTTSESLWARMQGFRAAVR